MDKECLECGDEVSNRFEDPRVPPMGIGYCLCAPCFLQASEELLDNSFVELERAVDETGLASTYDTRRS